MHNDGLHGYKFPESEWREKIDVNYELERRKYREYIGKVEKGELQRFCREFTSWQKYVKKRKERGENDFNMLLFDPRNAWREKLHTDFIHALLNPKGEHCQGAIFLDSFLRRTKIHDQVIASTRADVSKEKTYGGNRLDILISQGHKRIIIENKIGASDGEGQIARYIEAMAQELSELHAKEQESQEPQESNDKARNVYEDIIVVYISWGDDPSASSLTLGDTEWKVVAPSARDSGGLESCSPDWLALESAKGRVRYVPINYTEHILPWLESCQSAVRNISNLNVAIECYKDVVKTITYLKEDPMSIAAFFKSDLGGRLFRPALEIIKNQDEILRAYREFSLNDVILTLISDQENYEYDIDENGLRVWHKDFADMECLCVYVYFDSCGKKHTVEAGVMLSGEYENKDKAYKQKLAKALCEVIGEYEIDKICYEKGYWLYPKITEGVDKNLSDFEFMDFMEYFRSVKDKVYTFNQKIKADLDKGYGKSRLWEFIGGE